REIWIIPIINVDGYIYNQEQSPNGGGMWRKNRRDNGGSYGVDPNRNYTYMWGYDDQGSSPYPSDDTYRGPSAGSEPCNQAVMQFCESHDFVTTLHYHSYGEYFLYPWGYDQLDTPDHDLFVAIADSAVSMNGYDPGRAWELLYAVNGDAVDWSYGELGILAFTPEVGNSSDGFWPDPSRIQPLIDLNRPVNIYIAEVAGTLVKFNFPDGLPSLINPLGGTTVRVEISGGQDGTGILYYNDGSGWEQNSMTLVSSGVYDAVFPATDCGSTVDYYFSVLDLESGTHYNPAGAPAATYNVLSANGFISIFEDNFETNQGWTAENLGASSGDWQRGVPVNDPGWEYDPAADGDGSGQCYLTQNQTGNTDVDGGAVRLTSPSFDMSTGGKISYEYYLYLTDTSGGVDRLLVEMNDNGGAGSWYEVTRHDTNGSTSWRHSDITEDDITSAGLSLTANMMIRFTANDADPASIVEAGIDGFSVIVADCYLPDVTIEMIPDDDPVYTTQGGSFDFTGKLYNHTAQQQYTDVWIMLVLPNSNWFGPIRQWNNIPLAPNDSLVDTNASQYIPWYALVGDYEYWAFCGDYPSATMDSAMFEFLIFPGLNNGQNNWDLYSSFGGSDVVIPSETVLHDNYPNPFNATTQIKFDLSKACDVNLRVYNISGQLVETLLDGEMQSGHHIVEWNASTVSSGIYFYKLQAGEIITTKKMNLLK
ncbi:MAG: T9SS type A sorting domain-containing protein, partial [candidate division Zixibacteria bacterium]|nr:T9SS type A sorting domain-containing protein [candidate division Zixibacteria bacterium]